MKRADHYNELQNGVNRPHFNLASQGLHLAELLTATAKTLVGAGHVTTQLAFCNLIPSEGWLKFDIVQLATSGRQNH